MCLSMAFKFPVSGVVSWHVLRAMLRQPSHFQALELPAQCASWQQSHVQYVGCVDVAVDT